MVEALRRELLALERRYWQAIKDNDTKTTLALSADPCLVAGAQGVAKVDHTTMRAMMDKATYKLDAFELGDAQVMSLSDDIAVVAYKVHESLTVDGKAVELDAAETSTWVRRNGGWQCAVHSESLLGDPFGRRRDN